MRERSLSHFIRDYNYRNNLGASVILLNNILNQQHVRGKQVRRLVFTSSIAAFGAVLDPSELPMTEATPQRPEDPYGIAKHAVELDLKAAHHLFQQSYTIFRPHNVYGPRQLGVSYAPDGDPLWPIAGAPRPQQGCPWQRAHTGLEQAVTPAPIRVSLRQNIADKFRNAIGIFMNQILHGEPMSIFGDGSQSRGFSYIEEVAPPIAASVLYSGAAQEAFFVGTDAKYSVRDSACVASALGG